ncbi:MAG: hypothetical protein AMJ76_02135 [Dehalococcoidia bacterium SM23_28_1]|nr:MAG: hypothetical protein AMJ76_02135 [Dehalococcoidia bacterium SM23_28_1]
MSSLDLSSFHLWLGRRRSRHPYLLPISVTNSSSPSASAVRQCRASSQMTFRCPSRSANWLP